MIAAIAPNAAMVVIAAVLLMAGATAALSASNVAKRVAGVVVAMIAAMLGAGALGASGAVIVGAVAIAFAYCAVGASLTVRLQEGYASAETTDVDVADTEIVETPEQGA